MVRQLTAADVALQRMLRGDLAWPSSLDPSAFVERAAFHGVSALLHDTVALSGVAWPAGVVEQLRAAAQETAAIELARRHELERLLAQCAAIGIRPVLLKGTALAYQLYDAPHLRPRADVDLLIPAGQRRALAELLLTSGYATTPFQGGTLVNAQANYWRQLSNDVWLTLDVHWRISTSPLFAHVLPYDVVQARARRIAALGPHAMGASPIDLLTHACVHRAPMARRADTANRLIWLYDIHLLARGFKDAEWTRFTDEVSRYRVRTICRDALDAAAAGLGTPIPADVLVALENAVGEPSMALLVGGRWRLKRAELAALPTIRERLRYLRETVLPAPEYVLDQYGTRRRWLLPVLYVRRALGWLVR